MVVLELKRAGAPWPLMLCILLLGWTANLHHSPISFADLFSGEQAQANALMEAGKVGHAHDIKHGPAFDILGASGFALALNSALRLRHHAICPLGPVCSSWVWVNRNSSGRSYLNPLGSAGVDYVENANCMVSRVVAILLIITYRCSTWIVEQPQSSLMFRHPRWQYLIRLAHENGWKIHRVVTYLGSFGAATRKPILLYSNNHGLLAKVWRPMPLSHRGKRRGLVKRTVDKRTGKVAVTGIKKLLRESQWGSWLFVKHCDVNSCELACFEFKLA